MTTIYVVAHKPIDLNRVNIPKCYQIIRVGNYENITDVELRDDIGEDSISPKNKSYCELTALYWIWKNDRESDYIGLCHYRRFFTTKAISANANGIIKEDEIKRRLSKSDIIVPQKSYFWQGAVKAFMHCGFKKDIDLTGEAILKLHPSYYKYWVEEVINSPSNYLYNMFIMPRDLMDEYCTWLFSILFYVEERVDLTFYNDAEKRLFGYLSERLLGVWIAARHLKVDNTRVLNIEKVYGIKDYAKQLIKNTHVSDYVKSIYYALNKK